MAAGTPVRSSELSAHLLQEREQSLSEKVPSCGALLWDQACQQNGSALFRQIQAPDHMVSP